MKSDLKTVLDFMLDYGEKGDLPNMDEGGSGDIAYEAALRLADLQKGMADAISTAEDVARQEATDD